MPHQLASENSHTTVILVHPFVVSALKTAVNLGAFVHETTRIQHDVDFRLLWLELQRERWPTALVHNSDRGR